MWVGLNRRDRCDTAMQLGQCWAKSRWILLPDVLRDRHHDMAVNREPAAHTYQGGEGALRVASCNQSPARDLLATFSSPASNITPPASSREEAHVKLTGEDELGMRPREGGHPDGVVA